MHDVGGLEFGPIDREEHDLALWEKRTDAMLRLLVTPGKRAFTVDGMRRVIEDYGQQEYDRTTYYEKWIRAVRNLVVEQEILTREEVEARMAEIRARLREGRAQDLQGEDPVVKARAKAGHNAPPAGRFAPGDEVRVAERAALGHCRTPWYLRGKTRRDRLDPRHLPRPRALAYHRPGLPAQVLYKVRFKQSEIWGRYDGPAKRPARGRHLRAWLEPAA